METNDLFPYIKNGKMGLRSIRDGKVYIAPDYDWVSRFRNGIAKVEIEGNYYPMNQNGYISTKEHDDFDYDDKEDEEIIYDDGCDKINDEELYGKTISFNGVSYLVVDTYAYPFMVQHEGKYGFATEERLIVDCIFDAAERFNKGHAVVAIEGHYGAIDDDGKTSVPLSYDKVLNLRNNYFAVQLNEKWGIVDHCGKTVIPFEFDNVARSFGEGFGLKKNGKYGVLNLKGEVIVPFLYSMASPFDESGLSRVRIGKKWGYADIWGNSTLLP